ncbi:MAG: hypothetical protein WCO42_08500 [bacterium]
MENLNVWWGGLAPLNQWFFIAAAFFSVFFLWQLIATIVGLGGGDVSLDTHAEPSWEHQTPGDAQDTVAIFKLMSLRSILAFFTLFAWAGALYMSLKVPVTLAMTYALLWGVAAMLIVSWILYLLRRMTETGNVRISTTVNAPGTVHLDIPAGGTGEIRGLCSGVMTHLKARTAGGGALKAGAAVRILRVLGPNMVEVELDESSRERKDQKS